MTLYNPGTQVTIDEELVPFKGRCPIKQYIKLKLAPLARYGMKVRALADAQSYQYNPQVYCRKTPGSKPETGRDHRVVCDLVEPLLYTKRNMTVIFFSPGNVTFMTVILPYYYEFSHILRIGMSSLCYRCTPMGGV
uniref:PiggyBac transposable element-derived protein domain-containing protein n=1 Tax=Lutzomyia longipalpis TaxID=7200 RepID=A0A1B0CTV5_LUTLO